VSGTNFVFPRRVFITRKMPTAVIAQGALANVEVVADLDGPTAPAHLLAEALRSDGLVITVSERLDSSFFAAVTGSRLRIVSTMSTGVDHIDLVAADAAGVAVVGLPAAVTATATAELAWALVLGVARGLLPAHDDLRKGRWALWDPWQWNGIQLEGATLGIVGHGAIGRRVARFGLAFGMQVLCATRTPPVDPERFVSIVGIDDLAARSDVVSLHLPLTPSTSGMVDAAFLAKLKRGAILINTARGKIVDESAVLAALDSGLLAGVGMDVYGEEPVEPASPLVTHSQVLSLPHVGTATLQTRLEMAAAAVDAAIKGCVS